VTYSKKETMNLKDTTSVIMQQIPRKWMTHQWHPTQLNMSKIESIDASKIGNNCKA
jgi:hypothetical protein